MYKIEQLWESLIRYGFLYLGDPEQRSWVSVGHPDVQTLTTAPRCCPRMRVFQAGLMVRPFSIKTYERLPDCRNSNKTPDLSKMVFTAEPLTFDTAGGKIGVSGWYLFLRRSCSLIHLLEFVLRIRNSCEGARS
jgi:hypothetical protein